MSPSLPPQRKYHGKCVEKRLTQATCVNRITIAKALFIPPCPSTILPSWPFDQLCARSDTPGCVTRKLKLKTKESDSWKIHQTIAMQGERVVTLLALSSLCPEEFNLVPRIQDSEKLFFLVNWLITRTSKKLISFCL